MKRIKNFLKSFIAAMLIWILAFATAIIIYGASAPTFDDWEQQTYTVEKGDTLWEIGSRCCPENVDVRDWIEEVQKINNFQDGYLRAGEQIVVLVPVNAD
jgi:hypothetical protein